MKHAAAVMFTIVIVLIAGGGAAQTTTGRLVGSTVDETGATLPGVTVTIASPALIGGAQTRVTDNLGEFSFVGVAPGEYTVKAELVGFDSPGARQGQGLSRPRRLADSRHARGHLQR